MSCINYMGESDGLHTSTGPSYCTADSQQETNHSEIRFGWLEHDGNRSLRLRKYIDHFHDPLFKETHFSIVDSERIAMGGTYIDPSTVKTRRGPRGGVVQPFPVKLHEMLSQAQEKEFTDIVAWQPHGRCFVIQQPKRFVTEIMPKYFKQSKITSFQRQVNLYGFSRITQGKDRGGYYHELFLRGRPDLCKRMIRKRIKGTGTKSSPSPSTEPNFYTMQYCNENNNLVVSTDVNYGNTADSPPPHANVTAKPVETFSSMGGFNCGPSSSVVADHNVNVESDKKLESGKPSTLPTPVLTLNSMASAVVLPQTDDNSNFPSVPCPPHFRFPSDDFNAELPRLPHLFASPHSRESLVDPLDFDDLCLPSMTPSSDATSGSSTTTPHAGDELFFEGLPFRYLDSLILADVQCLDA